MIRLRRVSRRQVKFARLFVEYGGQGARAAVDAGYCPRGGIASGASASSRLLQNDRVLALVAAHLRDLPPNDRATLIYQMGEDTRRSRLVVRKLELLLADPAAAPRAVAEDDRIVLVVDQRQLDALGAVARFASAAGVGASAGPSVRKSGTKPGTSKIDPFS